MAPASNSLEQGILILFDVIRGCKASTRCNGTGGVRLRVIGTRGLSSNAVLHDWKGRARYVTEGVLDDLPARHRCMYIFPPFVHTCRTRWRFIGCTIHWPSLQLRNMCACGHCLATDICDRMGTDYQVLLMHHECVTWSVIWWDNIDVLYIF